MSDDTSNLRPPTVEEIAESLFHALRFSGRKHLVKHLAASNFVIMKGPPNPPPDTGRFSRPDKK